MRIETKELRIFTAVIEENGFNRAAEKLHITQSAVSQSIANLEQKLDTLLISRGKQLSLTKAGKRVYDYAHDSLRQEKQVLEDLSEIRQGESDVLSLAINSTINRYYAPELLSGYCRQHPHSRLNISELPSRSIIYAVLSGRAELGIGPMQKNMSAFESTLLDSETRSLVINPSHPCFEQITGGDISALKSTPLITSYLDEPDRRPGSKRIRDYFNHVWEVSSLSLRIAMVSQGLGAAYIESRSLLENSACRNFKVIKGIAFSSIHRQVGIYHKKGKQISECSRDFIAHCSQNWPKQNIEPSV